MYATKFTHKFKYSMNDRKENKNWYSGKKF